MRDILERLAAGALTVDEAQRELQLHAVKELEGLARLDAGRARRRGLPEIVRGSGKSAAEAVALAVGLLEATGRAILSQATPEHAQLLAQHPGVQVTLDEPAGMLVARTAAYRPPPPSGSVAIVTAGTSDIPVARQAQILLEETGCRVHTFWDVGVAGLHRLLPVVEELLRLDCDAVIAVAGQEGALVPVLAGLLDVPLVGLPTSTGSGYGGQGVSALMTMLQSCSLGVAVVNIDNGIAAGAVASAIARRAARRRGGGP